MVGSCKWFLTTNDLQIGLQMSSNVEHKWSHWKMRNGMEFFSSGRDLFLYSTETSHNWSYSMRHNSHYKIARWIDYHGVPCNQLWLYVTSADHLTFICLNLMEHVKKSVSCHYQLKCTATKNQFYLTLYKKSFKKTCLLILTEVFLINGLTLKLWESCKNYLS